MDIQNHTQDLYWNFYSTSNGAKTKISKRKTDLTAGGKKNKTHQPNSLSSDWE